MDGREEECIQCWWESQKERDHCEELGGRIILKKIFWLPQAPQSL
jgi:hypothetical protein